MALIVKPSAIAVPLFTFRGSQLPAVMGTCEHIVVLNFGQKLAGGSPTAVANPEVIAATLPWRGGDTCLRCVMCV